MITKIKKGKWHPRTFYLVETAERVVGEYPTLKEAFIAESAAIQADEQAWEQLGEEIVLEFGE